MSINQSIKPLTTKREKNLNIGGCDLTELAEKYNTPLYVVDEQSLRQMCREFKDAFKNCPNVHLMYASKAMCVSAITKIIDNEGLEFDTVSSGEINSIIKSGVLPSKILFNGNNKTKEEINFALNVGVKNFSVDNFYEAEILNNISETLNKKVDILIRITPGIECHTHNYIQTGQTDSKFGFDLTQIDEIVDLIKNKYQNLNLKGLHAHIGSQIFELQSYFDEVEILVEELKRINKKFNMNLSELNIGGGLGVKYTSKDNPPSVYDLANVIQKVLDKHSAHITKLYLEPGRSIISTSCVTLYKVGGNKKIPNGKKYVMLDGGMADNPRPSLYQAEYIAEVANDTTGRNSETVTLAGRYCESGDIIIENIELPTLLPDDIICIYNTGAYNYSMSSNYNMTKKPAMVLVNNSQSDIIVNRESLDDLIKREYIPNRLRK